MEVKPKFKQTEIGTIPNEWNAEKLGDHARFKTGPFGSALHKSDYIDHGVPIVNPMQIIDGKIIPSESMAISDVAAKKLSDFRLSYSEVVIGRRGDMGRCAFVETKYDGWLCGTGSMIIRPSKSLNGRFAQRVLSSSPIIAAMENTSVGTTMVNLNQGTLSNLLIPIPPIAEQEAIAEALSDVDALIESLEQLLTKKRQIKQGAMQELLTGRRRLPGFSEEWKVNRLGDIAHIKTGKMNNEDKVKDGLYPFFVRSETVERIDTYSHDCEAILVPGEGRIGEIFHYIDGRFNVHQRVYAITQFCENVSGRFIHAYMTAYFGAWAMTNTVKATVDSLRLPTFQNFQMTIPTSFAEQSAIANVLVAMNQDIEALEIKLQKSCQIKQGMMQELLTGRIRLTTPVESIPPTARTMEAGIVQPAPQCVPEAADGILFKIAPESVHSPEVDAPKSRGTKGHTWQFNEAVVLSVITKHFGSEKFPSGRMRRTKLTYLLHRHIEGVAKGYNKMPAGPYNPKVKYGRPEEIALERAYVQEHVSGEYQGFIAGKNIAIAQNYFDSWYGQDAIPWLLQFEKTRKEELELLTTVDKAMEELRQATRPVDCQSVKKVIQSDPIWAKKLDRAIFSDENIQRAVGWSLKLFP